MKLVFFGLITALLLTGCIIKIVDGQGKQQQWLFFGQGKQQGLFFQPPYNYPNQLVLMNCDNLVTNETSECGSTNTIFSENTCYQKYSPFILAKCQLNQTR